jgi:hypothetical protein
MGVGALQNNTTGSDNTAVGKNALHVNTTGNYSVAIGALALQANTTGQNVAIGQAAMIATTTGKGNVAVGTYDDTGLQPFKANTTGSQCVAIGTGALCASTTASDNSAVGWMALSSVTTGADNVALGMRAGGYGTSVITTGHSNTYLGTYSRASGNNAIGELVVGRYALGNGGSTATLGHGGNGVHIALNNSTTSWSKHSDERLKENIVDSSAGLLFINDLRPVTYTWKAKKDISSEFENHYDADSNEPVQGMEDTTYHGFLAQEVKEVIDTHSEIQNGHAIWRQSPDGIQNIADGALMPMMVKAMQELSTQVDELKSELLALKGE